MNYGRGSSNLFQIPVELQSRELRPITPDDIIRIAKALEQCTFCDVNTIGRTMFDLSKGEMENIEQDYKGARSQQVSNPPIL